MRLVEIIEDSVDISPMSGGIIIRRSRSTSSFLRGDRSRYSQDVKSLLKKLLHNDSIKLDTKIWLGDISSDHIRLYSSGSGAEQISQ